MIVLVTGNATIIGSKTLTNEEKGKVLAASEGQVKVVRMTLLDTNGNEVILKGKLYESDNGSLTSKLVFRTESCEVVEVKEKKSAGNNKATDLRKELGL